MQIITSSPYYSTICKYILPTSLFVIDFILVIITTIIIWVYFSCNPETGSLSLSLLYTFLLFLSIIPFICTFIPYVVACWALLLSFVIYCTAIGSVLYQFQLILIGINLNALFIICLCLQLLLYLLNCGIDVYFFKRIVNKELVTLLQRYHDYLQSDHQRSVRFSKSIPEQSLLVIAELFRQNNLDLTGIVDNVSDN